MEEAYKISGDVDVLTGGVRILKIDPCSSVSRPPCADSSSK